METTWSCFNIDSQIEYSWKKMLCIWWDQLGVVYYELLKLNETITGALYQIDEIEPSTQGKTLLQA